jgi:endonuclease/exonuclease/phosphatase family metal-dependent hydrolase
MRVRLMTFNIAHGRGLGLYQGFTSNRKLRSNLRRIADLITAMEADVVALQEVDEDSSWNHKLNLLEEIAQYCALDHLVMGVHTRRTGRFRLNYGNALLSRLPVSAHQTYAFGTRTLGEKGFLLADLETEDGRILPILNLHLDFRSRARRLSQVAQIIDCVESLHARGPELLPIVCGDFNVGSHRSRDATAELFRYLNVRHQYSLHPKGQRTFPAQWPQRTLDFIFVPEVYEVVKVEVVRSFLSDHRPVVAEIRLPTR